MHGRRKGLKAATILLAILLLSGASGCVLIGGRTLGLDCRGTGDLQINWVFDGVAACPDDVQDLVIKVTLEDGTQIHRNPQGDAVPCDRGEFRLRGLQCGYAEIKVRGVDADDAFTWTAPMRSVPIYPGEEAVVTINLHPMP